MTSISADVIDEGFSIALRALVPRGIEFRYNPVGWVTEGLGEHLWSKQKDIATSVLDNRYTAVKACHGPGKSYTAARLGAWWLDRFPVGEAFLVTTAPTWAQVNAILWRELRRAHKKADLPGRINLRAEWYVGDELVGYGRKPADYDEQAFQGIHARYVLVLIDEACGVPKQLIDAAESLATNEGARVVALGNPDDPSSHFETICRPGSGWNVITISAFDTPAFTGEEIPLGLDELLVSELWVEERRQRWGEGSPLWQSKVLGEFPDITDDTLITPKMLAKAIETELPGIERGRYSIDIARMGQDETVCYRNRGGVIREEWAAHKQDTVATTGKIIETLHTHKLRNVPAVVDMVGVGAGVYDNLREAGLPVVGFNGGFASLRPKRFLNLRAEMYWAAREGIEAGEIDLDPLDDKLLSQLGSIKYGLDSKGRIYIESKDDMRKRGLPSPDRADALVMSLWGRGPIRADPGSKKISGVTDDLLDKEW